MIRGRRVNQRLIFVSLDSSERGQLDARLEMPGHGTEAAILGMVVGNKRGVEDRIYADFLGLEELESILRGEAEPNWKYADEE